ncbi:DUF6571 family protein [Streptomyces sp. NEAU-H3]|uniref:DUF6571 family protein n=1 Tax=Streptomyces sp. NEAU-H3 TaxID=2720636 RepID=UPI00143979D6|nr:DUF6571 family protein [Streptomyces sp. NEAU-H3]NJA59695.1 hypothetical protein [Streptomyces sp. NEAU-H3]
MDPDATSGNFSGIDPDRFKKVITSVEHGHETLRDRALYFKNQLASYGIGQTELQGIAHSASWASDELPMLKRRYHLSLAEGAPGFAGHEGMVRINEALVNSAAVKEAKKAAKRAATLAKKDPKDLSASEFDQLNALLADNRDEYPFAETFAAALGAKGTLLFWDAMANADVPAGYGGKSAFPRGERLGEFQKNLSLTLAAATNSDTPAMRAWKKDMIALGDKPIEVRGHEPSTTSGPAGFVVMSNLMRFGDFDDKFLTDYGTALMKADRRHMENQGKPYHTVWDTGDLVNHVGNDLGNDPFTGYMKALANSPDAATQFFTAKGKDENGKPQSNFTYLFEKRKWPDDSAPGKESVTGLNSMGHALEAATTGHRPGELATAENLKHSKAQAGLFGDIVHSVSAHQDKLLERGFLSDSMADMAADYLPELKRAISGDRVSSGKLYPVTGTEAKLGPSDPARFLYTVARNEEGYDKLNVAEHAYSAQLMTEYFAGHNPGKYPRNAEQTVDDIAMETGTFQGLIAAGRSFEIKKGNVDQQARDDAWKAHASTWGGSVVGSAAGIATAPLTGPGGAVAGGLVGTAAGEVFNGILNGFGDDGKRKEQVYKDISDATAVRESVFTAVQNAAEAAGGNAAAVSRAGTQASEGMADAQAMVAATQEKEDRDV